MLRGAASRSGPQPDARGHARREARAMNASPLIHVPSRPVPVRLAMAAAVAAVGLTASVVWAAVGLSDQTRRPAEMVTATTPGSVTVRIARPGTHVIYLESAVPTAVRDLDPVLGLTATDLTVDRSRGVHRRRAPLHARPAVRRASRWLRCRRSGRRDVRRRPVGRYVVATDVRLADPTARIAVGDDLAPGVLRAVLLPMLTGLLARCRRRPRGACSSSTPAGRPGRRPHRKDTMNNPLDLLAATPGRDRSPVAALARGRRRRGRPPPSASRW